MSYRQQVFLSTNPEIVTKNEKLIKFVTFPSLSKHGKRKRKWLSKHGKRKEKWTIGRRKDK